LRDRRPKAPRPGLALGGGASRGWAHLGVIRFLSEQGIEPSCVAGTSIGAVVGALLASGRLEYALDEIMKADLIRVLSYVSPGLRDGGLIDSWKIHNLLRAWFGHVDIADLRMPFAAVATDLSSGDTVVLDSGDLVSALMASISIPVVFPPRFTQGRWLMDGGLSDPVPVAPTRGLGADFVIAVSLNSRTRGLPSTGSAPDSTQPVEAESSRPPSMHETLLATLMITERNLANSRLSENRPEVLIEPDLYMFKGTEFHRAAELSEIGYEAAGNCSLLLEPLRG